MSAAERLDAAFAALADPTRRAILLRLREGEATVGELASPFDISQPAVSRHLKVLESAGLIARRIDGTRRPCRLVPGALDDLDEYLARLREVLEVNYARLDRLLAASRPTSPNTHQSSNTHQDDRNEDEP